ncbi:hypothetical protein ACJMK2_003471 [Sinanodonta woodiana]|uniref:OTU domain-containing protein n=1 Tax=Sinanodonta woodiana TaxID=1069815 RepID=A0ABD3Y1P0_SINWO
MAKREKQFLSQLRMDHHQLEPAQRYIDFAALGYMEQNANKDCQTYRPLLTTGDGNCLFNALSIALCGAESMCCEIKVRTCIEMAFNEQLYITQTYSRDFMLFTFVYRSSQLLGRQWRGIARARLLNVQS